MHLYAGFAARCLLPDLAVEPLELSGYAARIQPATGVRDPLQVGALALATEAAKPHLLIALDLCAAAAAAAALDALAPCRLGWGRAVLTDPPWGNRRDPAGVVDLRLHGLKIERADRLRTPVCLLWSAACHAVVLEASERRISADWVGVVRARLPYPPLFVPGCCGDQNPKRRGESALADWTAVADRLQARCGVRRPPLR